MNTKKAILNFFYSVVSQIITISLGLIVPRMVLVGYGSEINGLLNSVTQFIVYLNLFEAGVQLVAVQSLYSPVSIGDKTAINRILSAVNKNYKKTGVIYFSVLLCLAAIYPFFIHDSEIGYWTVFGVMLFSGMGNVILFFFQGKYKILLQAEGKHYILTNVQTIIAVLNNTVKIILLLKGYNVVCVVFASFVVNLIQVVYIYILINRKYPWIDLSQTPDLKALEQKNSALIHQLAGMVFQNTDVLILTIFCGLKVVSVYSMYKMITSHLASLINGFYNSFSFALGQKFSMDKTHFGEIIDTVEVYFSGIVFSIYTVTLVLFIPFIELYTEGVSDIQYADMKICILFVVVELLTYARIPMLNTINYAGHFKNTLPQTIIETIINLALSLSLVRPWGIHGVLIGTITALIYRDIDVILYTNHKILGRSAKKTFCIYGIDIVLFSATTFFINKFFIQVESLVDFFWTGLWLTPCAVSFFVFTLSLIFRKERVVLKEKVYKIRSTRKGKKK